jgi:molybdenum cofactor biosynthesis protein B
MLSTVRDLYMSTKEHKARAPKFVRLAILTVSTTRSLSDDKSGRWIKKRAQKERHEVVFHDVVPDDQGVISETVSRVIQDHQPHAILVTGGTGIGPFDVTIEAIRPMFTKELTAFGALFTYLSYEDIDSAALLSRATAGLIGQTLVFCMPGSLEACKLACKELIFPELGHLLKHVQEAQEAGGKPPSVPIPSG